jgi:two-component system NtrC family sensor kinase
VVTFSGEQIDKVMQTASKVYGGSIIIAEVNVYDRNRNGMVLYNGFANITFAKNEAASMSVMQIDGGRLWNAVQNDQDRQGQYTDARNVYKTFYSGFTPYPHLDGFVDWIVAIRINLEEVRAPFNRIRIGIFALAGVTLLLTLLLARWGAQKLASPITKLATSLKAYADGNHDTRVSVKGNAEEIQQLEQSFNYMADNIDKAQTMMLQSAKLASIGQMAAGIGHEINNPLNNILSLVKLIEREAPRDSERMLQDLNSLREESKRASEIIKGVLNFARQVPPQYSHFDVTPWIQETLRLVNQAAKNKMITLVFEAQEEYELDADRSQLQQVLVNLLLNAIQASPEQSTVHVTVFEDLKRLKIQVVDQGEGVKQEFLSSIYDPFFTTKPEGEGTGLGLSISLGIVERHNGTLVIENNKDKGVTATITLPYDDEV